MKGETIRIEGARVHNLKNIDLEIPRDRLVVITGLSGSGKSSLAFDTIYAEGQRRYMETLSAYARQFVGTMERPDVDSITGLSPVVAIEQKTTNRNPRSTVGTVTEINDFLRLLFARAARAFSPVTGEEMVHYTEQEIAALIAKDFAGRRVALMAPVVRGRKGHYRELFEGFLKKGFLYARIDGRVTEITPGLRLDRYKIHTIDLVIDRLEVEGETAGAGNGTASACEAQTACRGDGGGRGERDDERLRSTGRTDAKPRAEQPQVELCRGAKEEDRRSTPGRGARSPGRPEPDERSPQPDNGMGERLLKSLREALRQGKGTMAVYDYDSESSRFYSRHLMCPTSGIAFDDPAPHTFSFNSPQGACPHCNGLGQEAVFDLKKIVPDQRKSIRDGAVEPLGKWRNNYLFALMEALGRKYGFRLDDPVEAIPPEGLNAVLYGDPEPFRLDPGEGLGSARMVSWDGIADYIDKQEDGEERWGERWREQFMVRRPCSECGGTRLRRESLQFRINGLNIAQVCAMSITEFAGWIGDLAVRLTDRERAIASEVIKEIGDRTGFLVDVGLGYLSLARASQSLSGGESQRIRLATQIGSQLVNVLYILDEPSIGLHQRDNRRLIASLGRLRDAGNSVIVVEHDAEMIRSADYIVDVGPLAGRAGGEIVAAGPIETILASDGLTADYLAGRREIPTPAARRKGSGRSLTVRGARGNNLKNIDVSFPLGVMICVTGVSGSGKSSLVTDTLCPAISRHLYRSFAQPLECDSVEGIDNIDKLVVVDQSPIGRTPRSNPATYSNLFADIRKLFESTPDAKIRGFKAGRFSFNVKGGRCEDCHGAGVQTIEMNFLPDVYVECKTCGGHRYNPQTLEVKYKGKNIDQVLSMTVNAASEFFENIPSIASKLLAIKEVGLGYLTLGQPCTTLSGGESQRIKLSSELAKRDTGRTLYIFDEPTTGLHFEDVRQLMEVMHKLVERGNTVVIIEHNLDVIKVADHIIDIGPEGGAEGGRIVAQGTPEQVATIAESYTGQFLKDILKR